MSKSTSSSPASRLGISDSQLIMLEKFDTIFLVDDSTSMGFSVPYKESGFFSKRKSILRWELAGRALEKFATIAAHIDKDGIEVYFLNSPKCGKNLKTQEEIASLFQSIRRSPGTPIGTKLTQILTPYLDQTQSGSSTKTFPKPRNYIIITDGQPGDRQLLKALLRKAGALLNACQCPKEQLGLQFVQIGDDEGATRFLDGLDNSGIEFKRDFIDTVKHSPTPEAKGLVARLGLGNNTSTSEEDMMHSGASEAPKKPKQDHGNVRSPTHRQHI